MMDFKLFHENQTSIPWENALNQRIILTEMYPALAEVGIMCFGHYSNKVIQPKLARGHHGPCYEIHYIEAGAQPFYTYPDPETPEEEAELHWIHGGDISVTAPYEYHSTGAQPQQRGSVYWIQLDSLCPNLLGQSPACVALLKKALARLNCHVLHITKGAAGRLIEAFELLQAMDEERLCRACSLLSLFVFEIADCAARHGAEAAQERASSQRAQEAVSFIKDNLFAPNLDLALVAEHMHYSRTYAATFFKREIGLTIHEYIMRSKIDSACELLKEHSTTKVAALLNFSSSQHFCKVFKEQIGITPTEFVKKLTTDQISMARPDE